MQSSIHRRTFMFSPLAAPLVAPILAWPAGARPKPASGSDDLSHFPRQDPALVRAVVLESHRSLDAVRDLVEGHPELAKASIDWGFGDWESALGAASHTGQREIALYLIDRGARPTIFTYAMLGHLSAVKAMIEATPGLQRTRGPHGIPLLDHARNGGMAAANVLAYLESLGDAGGENLPTDLAEAERKACVGRYRLQDDNTVEFEVTLRKDQLWVGARPLYRIAGDPAALHPAGAPSVRFYFEIEEKVPPIAGWVTISTPARTLRAKRI